MGGQQSQLDAALRRGGQRSSEPVLWRKAPEESADDTDSEPYEVVLSRSETEAWGFAWNVGAHAAQRLLIAGVDPSSPAGRWNQEQQVRGNRRICRGDELVEVNGVEGHEEMRRELVAAGVARLLFRRPVEAEAELAAAAAAAALAKQRRSARQRAAAVAAGSGAKLWPDSRDVSEGSCPVSVKNTFIHVRDPDEDPVGVTDNTSELGQLSLSDPLPLPSVACPDASGDAGSVSDASFYSADSRSSVASRSSDSLRRPSSSGGRSCPSTDWEFRAYNCQGCQEQLSSSSHKSRGSSGQGRRRRRTVNMPLPQPAAMPAMVQPIAPTMVPVLVPYVGTTPGQHFVAMAPMSTGIAMPVPAYGPALCSTVPGSAAMPPAQADVDTEEVPPNRQAEPQSDARASPGEDALASPPKESGVRRLRNEEAGAPKSEAPQSQPLEANETPGQAAPARKKPTRRGGKRARHRPCHVASATAEWASSIGSIETPSFGDPGSGEEAEGEAESEAEIEADLHAGNTTTARAKDPPKGTHAPKPRSFYPLAARLKVASAGLKPFAELVRAEGVEPPAQASLAREETDSFEAKVMSIDQPAREDDANQEVTEEVEPEPASASDFSDPQPSKPALQTTSSAAPDEAPTKQTDLAFAVATLPALTKPPAGTASTAVAPQGWPLPAPSQQGNMSCPTSLVGCRVQITGLVRTSEFNGQWGKVQDFDAALGRFSVQLLTAEGPSEIVKLCRENLHVPPVLALRFEDDGAEAKLPPTAALGSSQWKPTLRHWELAADLQ
eukprot:TRINITY_DN27639_c0_g1_i1.p1 TRINITY_DN27639_c0_g1~~TRINITY_DN27639_c0_g1_i1.p1  ORF type:complete len:781 (+),score=185.66 TRINITY_DN27639_c0_g1_i1:160-2502(+)